jgi:hypothetical protein
LKIAAGAVTMSDVADEFEEIVELRAEDVVEEEELPAVGEPSAQPHSATAEPPLAQQSPPLTPPAPPKQPVSKRRSPDSALVPVVQAVAAAATGFAAGAAALALARRHSERRLARAQRRALTAWRGPGEWNTRTYLVQVHVLGRSAD